MKVSYASLGCKVNLYESEAIVNQFIQNGFEAVPFHEQSDVMIINTCTVTATSDSKSRKLIRQAVKRKNGAIVAVMGCFSQLNPEQIVEIEGVDLILGTTNRNLLYPKIMELIQDKKQLVFINDSKNAHNYEEMKINRYHNKTRGFVKIQDGCDNFCSYCRIPYARGPIRSRNKEDIIQEIQHLTNLGMNELVLTGINTATYGMDFTGYTFANLLQEIVDKVSNLGRIRISSIEATEISDELLNVIAKNKRHFCDHFHIPLQGGTNALLQRMNRKYNIEFYENTIKRVRNVFPNCNITTDIMIGFAGETERDFKKTCEFVEIIGFGELHVFPYSKRLGTKAYEFSDHVNEITKRMRVNEALTISKKLALEYRMKCIGQEYEVIVEKVVNGIAYGHTSNYISVRFPTKLANQNDLVKLTIVKAEYPYSLGECHVISKI